MCCYNAKPAAYYFLCEDKDTCRFSDVHYCNFKDLHKIFTLRFFKVTQRKIKKLGA